MATVLSVPFIDAQPQDLVLSIGLPPQPALATKTFELPVGRLEMRLLGSSHQVIVEGPSSTFSETVACLNNGGSLPSESSDDGYRFYSSCMQLGERFDTEVADLLNRLEDKTDALTGIFPGHRLALTGIELIESSEGISWRTWHAYPQSATLVRTDSTLVTS